MGMFKSKEEKRIERDIEVRKGVNSLKRNIRDLAKHEVSYIAKAKKARKIGDQSQYDFLKRQLKKTAGQRRMRERQLLSIETAVQIKNQAESDADFAKTQKNFEKAMMQADTLQQQMEIFLEMTQEHVMSGEVEGEDQVVSDAEIDKMLDEEVVHEEGGSVDKDIEKGLKDIQDELDRER